MYDTMFAGVEQVQLSAWRKDCTAASGTYRRWPGSILAAVVDSSLGVHVKYAGALCADLAVGVTVDIASAVGSLDAVICLDAVGLS